MEEVEDAVITWFRERFIYPRIRQAVRVDVLTRPDGVTLNRVYGNYLTWISLSRFVLLIDRLNEARELKRVFRVWYPDHSFIDHDTFETIPDGTMPDQITVWLKAPGDPV